MISQEQQDQFQVFWHHLNYTIKEEATLSQRAWDEFKQTINLAPNLNFSSKRGSYDLKGSIEDNSTRHGIHILDNLHGSFQSGQLTAVLGPSGAGKTSLLNLISRRRHTGYTGTLLVSGPIQRNITINAIAQDDHLPDYLTVRESLSFASQLKNPASNWQEHEENVARVSKLLGLEECLETRTGRISGGQKKRLSIGQELLSKPDILILDEPTSGLDSTSCLQTLSVLKDVVRINMLAIVLTIHQPPVETLEQFDKMYVLTRSGQVIYDGPSSRCSEFINAYSGLELPQGYNPGSFLIEIGSEVLGWKPIEALRAQVEREYYGSKLLVTLSTEKQSEISTSPLHIDDRLCKGANSCDKAHYLSRTRSLVNRCNMSMGRDPKQMISRVLMHLALPFGMLMMLGREPGESNACPRFASQYNLQEVVASDQYTSIDRQTEFLLSHENVLMFYILIYSCICGNIAITTLIFTMDMRSSLREYNNGWYSISSYLVAKFTSNIASDVMLPTLAVALTYWLTGQDTQSGELSDVYRVAIISLALIVGNFASQVLGMTFAAIYVDDIASALFISQAVTLPFVLLSGFLVRVKEMSAFVRMLSVASIYRHCLEATYVARYGFNVCECKQLVGSGQVTMTGVPDRLRSFSSVWLDSLEANAESNSTTAFDVNNQQTQEYVDIFQLIARQLNLYNTFGMDVQSCKDVVPYQLHDFGLTETDLTFSFSALLVLSITMSLVMFLTVKLTVGRKGCL